MNTKISKLFAGALLMGLWACSSDEPARIPTEGDGEAYLAVDIMDANSNTRAGDDEEADKFQNGTESENKIHNSLFVFFDKNGSYLCTGKMTSGDFENQPDGGNVESIGKNVIVLSELNGVRPKYMMTILNNPSYLRDKIVGKSMSEAKKLLLEYVPAPGTPFIMTTSSHGGIDSMVSDIEGFELMTDKPVVSEIPAEKWVTVYVERLSVGVDLAMSNGTTSFILEDDFQIGEYDENGEMQFTTKKLVARIDGWGLNSTARKTYLSKDIDGLKDAASITGWLWDNPTFHRSYWGKSVGYGESLLSDYIYLGDEDINTPYSSNDLTLQYFNWNQLTNQVHTNGFTGGTRAYCLENTNTVDMISSNGTLLKKNVTCAIVKATLTDKGGKTVNVVRYQGVLFLQDDFVRYTLNLAKEAGYLPFYTVSGTETAADGSSKTLYKQLEASDFKIGLTGKGTGVVSLVNNIEAGTQVYKLTVNADTGQKEYTLVTDLTDIDKTVQSVIGTGMAYTDGAMFYVVPIKHLRKSGDTLAEGEYGVVRNHLYQITVGNISKLGNGVFEPGREKEDENPGEPIIPDYPNPDFYLSARINILAWRVVGQTIDF